MSKTNKNSKKKCCKCKRSKPFSDFIGTRDQETKTCIECRNINKLADLKRSGRLDRRYKVETRIKDYRKKCRTKDIPIELTDYEMKAFMMRGLCFYCHEIYNGVNPLGIDRVNPDKSIGYVKSNCVTCCRMCNFMKRKLDIGIFIEMCRIITVHLGIFSMKVNRYVIPNKRSGYICNIKVDVSRKDPMRNIEFLLSDDEFHIMKGYACYLCGKENSKLHKNGIDRINSNESYTVNNCKTCCGTCNFIKNNFDLVEVLYRITKITIIHTEYLMTQFIKNNKIMNLLLESNVLLNKKHPNVYTPEELSYLSLDNRVKYLVTTDIITSLKEPYRIFRKN